MARPSSSRLIQAGFGQRLVWTREALDISQAELSRLLEVDPSTLSKIEKGQRAPSIFNVVAIANRLKISTDFLLRGHLRGQTDEILADRLIAMHPELVLRQIPADTDRRRDNNPAGGKPLPPRRRKSAQKVNDEVQ